ncbi:hypothetical protein EVAR_52362_1 [Eumeta japonica]|uniref:Uncharacterized protein n=1 Tax=Eumeta variegata TaxID=151549 RepID=A0A4C1YVD8_EUMVA|nr:hypothetical protein EVAR_52362_1 [Eumeta japonica]
MDRTLPPLGLGLPIRPIDKSRTAITRKRSRLGYNNDNKTKGLQKELEITETRMMLRSNSKKEQGLGKGAMGAITGIVLNTVLGLHRHKRQGCTVDYAVAYLVQAVPESYNENILTIFKKIYTAIECPILETDIRAWRHVAKLTRRGTDLATYLSPRPHHVFEISYFLLRIASTRLILKNRSTLSMSILLAKVEESISRNIFFMNVYNYTLLQENTPEKTITNMFGLNLDRSASEESRLDAKHNDLDRVRPNVHNHHHVCELFSNYFGSVYDENTADRLDSYLESDTISSNALANIVISRDEVLKKIKQ